MTDETPDEVADEATLEARRRLEQGASDYGSDLARDLGDGPPASWRDAAPQLLEPIDADSPVSGHVPAAADAPPVSLAPEHDWDAARVLLVPLLRPAGQVGIRLADANRSALAASTSSHTLPLVGDGPGGLSVVYAIPASGFDVVVNGEHLVSWGVDAADVHAAAMANLGAWSAAAPWTGEESGERRLLSSDRGDGPDATRILLPEVRAHLLATLGPAGGPILVGLPDRHLLVAGASRADDAEFALQLSAFVADHADGADEPIDRRLFVLADDDLRPFDG
ncbi:MAG TPA: hypothetical protein VKR24_11195 [Candidatus Limnocylindrales bacterium]|nr:hypothetical protein [Candidatus Limnocylindrales bacterium]